MPELEPVHLLRWIDANRQAFAPPVANKEVFPESEFIYQIVRGPNARNDFHIDPGDEIFYQLAGDITVRCRQAVGRLRDVHVREGESLLVRAGTPHCPIRPAGTWGLVIERKRRPEEVEEFLWFCEKCDAEVLARTVVQGDTGAQVTAIYEAFNADPALRTCKACGYVFPVTPRAQRLGFLDKNA